MVTGNENTVLSELHKTVYATGLKLHFKLLRLNYITKLDKFKTELKTYLFKKAFKCNS